MNNKKVISNEQTKDLLDKLKTRFEKNMDRHGQITWDDVLIKLKLHPEKLWSLHEMERTGGEPDVVGDHANSDWFMFFDCSQQSPNGRRTLCYDHNAWQSRKEYKPQSSAEEVADAMGIELLTEEDYVFLQTLGEFDTKTSSWIQTPTAVRTLGGALYGDHRFNRTFIYHNGAESYYASRGFRGKLRL